MLYRIVFLSGVFYATALKSDFIQDVKDSELVDMDAFIQEGTPLMLIKAEDEQELVDALAEMGIKGNLEIV